MAEKPNNLFTEFSPPSYEAWVEATVKSLKGRPFSSLISQMVEGIEIRPFYTQADTADLLHIGTQPGQPPYVRGNSTTPQPWLIAQNVSASKPKEINRRLKRGLSRGQTAVFWVPEATFTAEDFRTTLAEADLTAVPLFLLGQHGLPLLAQLAAAKDSDLTWLRGGLFHDPLAFLAAEGSFPLVVAYDQTAVTCQWAQQNAPHFATLAVLPLLYHEAGANAVQELALMLATAVHHIRELQERGLSVNSLAPQMWAVFAIGGDFFMEVAKFRAARLVWAQMIAAFGGDENAQKLKVHAQTAAANKSSLDPHVNMLRVTAEAFAAALGGVQSLQTTPYDERLHQTDEFSQRIARNVQIILQEEVNLTQLIDPAAGAYYVDILTDELARRSWALFQEIEAQGGILAALQNGFVQKQITQTAVIRQENLATRESVLVGTNMYPNLDEERPRRPSPEVEGILLTRKPDPTAALRKLQEASPANWMTAAIEAAAAGATSHQITDALLVDAESVTVSALEPFQAATPFAQLRKNADRYVKRNGRRPQLFLAKMGSLRQHKARADFARSFFEVGGFGIVDSGGFETVEEAAQAASEIGTVAVVICSTDETYPEIVPPLVQKIKEWEEETAVILAGYPKDQIKAHKAAGIDAFIHLGADCLALNQWLQTKIERRSP